MNQTKFKNINKYIRYSSILPLVVFVFLGQLFIRPLLLSYSTDDNPIAEKLLVDEIAYNSFLSKLNPGFGKVATWYEPDESAYRNSLISSSAFHLLRIEGPAASNSRPILDRNSWNLRKGEEIECLVLITSINWKVSDELSNYSDFINITEEILPSKSAKLTLMCNYK